ncbi:plasmid partitioning protein RepB [Marinovum sp. 2_MG-2023]|uniref:plasmid partitioning protein RepB n=1 Tax=unclassified Marinovum TaxID=2647166 RepID=UPI0026E27373|nr:MULTISPECIES: plasmid partitioning protein RepB [unclassified Marinovum]MDO6731200.1 plasmid partitioning protein RepB [Marinovum sp. 2_MG-2023]MDO6780648.1 plasmid partitioning protein RepB [Marinovum sp. 1_MG-2023]
MARSVFETGPGPAKPDETAPDRPARPKRKPIIKGGAASDKYIRAATQGGADRTYQEIDVDQIQDSRIRDRIDVNEDLDSLVESIEANGQQIPILVRVAQGGDKAYEIVVGRRRLAATRRLGRTRIKAFVSKMDDREAFVAQGIENSARLETSYIERARAAAQGIDAGYEQKDIAEFLSISRTLINFMVKSYQAIGEDLVLAIGPARGVGRRNWDKLISEMSRAGISRKAALKLVDRSLDDSVDRFHAVLKAVQSGGKRPAPPPAATQNDFLNGRVSISQKSRQLVIKTRKDAPPEMLEQIRDQIEQVIRNFEGKEEE